MVIQHNLSAFNTNRQLGIVFEQKATLAEKLASGYRINKSADDAAGLAISEKMRRQIRGLKQGIANTEDGISLCQVADGALEEVHDMLQRMNQLAIQAANGTNSDTDRSYIQNEISMLVTEIDRIGDTTAFNEIKVFEGDYHKSGSASMITGSTTISTSAKKELDFDKITLDCSLDQGPFDASSDMKDMKLVATDGVDSWSLIYEDGLTSIPNIRGQYVVNGQSKEFIYQFGSSSNALVNSSVGNYQANESGGVKSWSRDVVLENADGLNLTIRQTVKLEPKQQNSQYFTISYNVINNSTFSLTYDFLQNIDIAYNSYDYGEDYYLSGAQKLGQTAMYTTNAEYTAIAGNSHIHNSIPSEFSVINVDEALAFTEKIVCNAGDGGAAADTLVFGKYDDSIFMWNHYSDAGLKSILGQTTDDEDMVFNMIWSNRTVTSGASDKISYKQGIYATMHDTNLPDSVLAQIGKNVVGGKQDIPQHIWIQAGCDVGDGMMLTLSAMDGEVLGIDEISVTTEKNASKAIDKVSKAIQIVSAQRSRIGAYQNRLEHTIKNEENIVENTTASESKIRDTDMAKTMVWFSNVSILQQAGQSMLAQTNQSNEGILTLLR